MGSGINSFYLQSHVQPQLRSQLRAKGALPAVALGQFLTDEAFKRAVRACATGWTHINIPDQYSFATHKRIPIQDEMAKFVTLVTDKKSLTTQNQRFTHRDYTLLHDDLTQEVGLLAIFCLDDVPSGAGGDIVFMKQGEMLGRFAAQRNTLLLVECKKEVQYFVQYLNHKVGKRALTLLYV